MSFKFNNDRDEKGRFKKNKTESHMGTYEDMMKERKRKLPEMMKEIEKFFENWDGATVVLIRTQEDENGNAEGHHEAIIGVDKPGNLLGLAKHTGHTAERIIENVVKNGDPKVLAEMAVDMLKEMMEDFENGKNR